MITVRRQLPALTGMRFFLALWVVVYHQSDSLLEWIGGSPAIHKAAASLVLTGYSAVSAFFVLSGFVLAYNYDLRTLLHTPYLSRFAIARFSRIYPAYATGLLLLIPFAIYRLAAGVQGSSSTGTGNFFLNMFLLQAWIPRAALTWNYPGWSLSDEAFFYAALPFAGAWMVRIGGGKTGPVAIRLIGLAAGLWVLSLAMPVVAIAARIPHFGDAPATDIELLGAGQWANVIRYNPLLRLPEFCIGAVLALLYRLIPAGSRLWKRGAYFYIPAVATIVLVLANADIIPYPVMHDGLLDPAYAMLIFGLALEGGVLVRLLSMPVLVFLGNASYSMYILHVPVYVWMNVGFRRVLHVDPHGMFWLICYVTAVVGLSALFFRKAEEPAHRWVRRSLTGWAEGLPAEIRVPRS
jgi:peptidoglycan/LPS O-acetylase OafA/YrhL